MAGMERFTQKARRVLSLAHQEAERARSNHIGTEHLLLGLMDEEGGVAGRVLHELGMASDRVREVINRVTSSSASFDPSRMELAAEVQQVLEHAVEEARRLGHHYIGTEHILLGLVRVDSTAMEVLRRLGVNAEQIRRQTRRVLNESTSTSFDKIPNSKKINQVFILHGQDEWKKTVAALIRTLGLVPVLVDEKNVDNMIVEYLDVYPKEVALAVIILTNDDESIIQSHKQPDWHVDHNLIYELGYFRGKLGRNRTCVLYVDDFQNDVELLSVFMFMGVILVPLDTGGAWTTQLAKVIQDTGVETNLINKL